VQIDNIPEAEAVFFVWLNQYSGVQIKTPTKTLVIDPVDVKSKDFPEIDAVLITHEHYDHLDPPLVAAIQAVSNCQVIAAPVSATLPPDCEFDRRRFAAYCYSGLSAAYGKIGKHMECFAAANKALGFYDEAGDQYPADVGRWLMALANQGTSLAALRCLDAALEALLKAKDIFVRHGLNTEQNKQWLAMVDGNIEAIRREAQRQQQKQEPEK